MPFYRITFTDKGGKEWDDYLHEATDISDAQWYAEHRIDGSYGPTDFVKAKAKRITFSEAKTMVDGNCVCWANDERLFY